MTTTAPLDQVAQSIARQAAELEALRRDYEVRKRQLADLTRHKQQLQSQLDKVETDIRALTGGSSPAPAPAVKPAAAGMAPPVAAKSKSKSAVSLPELVQKILRDAGRPLTHRELADEMARRKYPTKSSDLMKQVTTRVGEMVKKGLLRRTKDGAAALPGGVASGPPAAFKPVQAPTAAKASPAASFKSAGEQPPLRLILTSLLEKSKLPIPGGELARLAKAAGYRSTSTDFPNLVHVTLNKMNNIERIKGQGYRLKKR